MAHGKGARRAGYVAFGVATVVSLMIGLVIVNHRRTVQHARELGEQLRAQAERAESLRREINELKVRSGPSTHPPAYGNGDFLPIEYRGPGALPWEANDVTDSRTPRTLGPVHAPRSR